MLKISCLTLLGSKGVQNFIFFALTHQWPWTKDYCDGHNGFVLWYIFGGVGSGWGWFTQKECWMVLWLLKALLRGILLCYPSALVNHKTFDLKVISSSMKRHSLSFSLTHDIWIISDISHINDVKKETTPSYQSTYKSVTSIARRVYATSLRAN